MIYQDLPHQSRRQRQEMRAAVECHAADIHQTQIHFVDQGRRLERVVCPLATQVSAGELSKFVVDQRDQALERFAVPFAPGNKEFGDIRRIAHGRRQVYPDFALEFPAKHK